MGVWGTSAGWSADAVGYGEASTRGSVRSQLPSPPSPTTPSGTCLGATTSDRQSFIRLTPRLGTYPSQSLIWLVSHVLGKPRLPPCENPKQPAAGGGVPSHPPAGSPLRDSGRGQGL